MVSLGLDTVTQNKTKRASRGKGEGKGEHHPAASAGFGVTPRCAPGKGVSLDSEAQDSSPASPLGGCETRKGMQSSEPSFSHPGTAGAKRLPHGVFVVNEVMTVKGPELTGQALS